MRPKNVLFTATEVLTASGGVLIAGDMPSVEVSNVQVDSRKCANGSLFVPLPGERTDGHLFLDQALENGSSLCFVDRRYKQKHKSSLQKLQKKYPAVCMIQVSDTLRAHQQLAKWHLDRHSNLETVAITGSNGKTTTKELVGGMLSSWRPTAVSPGNLNSDIGLPLAAGLISTSHEMAVFEMGMNRRGEISDLTDIVRPHTAAITNIGTAHIGLLGSQDAIAAEKKSIFKNLEESDTAIFYEDDAYSDFLSRDIPARIVTYGPRTTQGYDGSVDRGLEGNLLHLFGREVRFPLIGEHNVLNALCAVTIAQQVGCPERHIIHGLTEAKPLFGRNEIVGGPVTVIRDCYNANAESTEKAIDFLDALFWTGRKILVTGSMKELGEKALEKHEIVARRAASSDADKIYLYGAEFGESDIADPRILRIDDFEDLKQAVLSEIREGDLVLVKGSRSLGLERLADVVAAYPGVQAC